MNEMFHATNLKKIMMQNLNGKLVKIKEYNNSFKHEGVNKELQQFEIITQVGVRVFNYLITDDKVTCL